MGGAICRPAGLQLETCGIAVGNLRDCIRKPTGLHMETCGIAYGNLPDCIWKPAGLHMETCGIAYGSQLDCFCQLDCIRDVQKMIAPSLIDEAMYRGGRKSFLAISS